MTEEFLNRTEVFEQSRKAEINEITNRKAIAIGDISTKIELPTAEPESLLDMTSLEVISKPIFIKLFTVSLALCYEHCKFY